MQPIESVLPGCFDSHSGLIKRCESPIEVAFAGGFLINPAFSVVSVGEDWRVIRGAQGLVLKSQLVITSETDPLSHGEAGPVARADFAFFNDAGCLLLIETDGHSFHEATPEQITRDRVRDRMLLRCGYKVARFTGKELAMDAKGCAVEAFSLALIFAGERG